MLPTDQKQQFHSLYNSQLSVSQRNKLIRPLNSEESSSSWNGVEIGVYTVLCVFGILMTVFTTSCFVYAVKQKNNSKPSEFTTVTTVKQNDQDDSGFGGDLLNTNTMRFNKMINEWPWLQKANKFVANNRSDDEENQISGYDENGNPIITNKVNVRSNPFDNDSEDDDYSKRNNSDNKNRQSIISYPGSEISIQITANPIVNAIENVAKNALNKIREDKKDKQLQETPTPEPDFQEIKSMLSYCKSIEPKKQINQQQQIKLNKQPPPIPPRRSQQTNSATFVRGKRAPNQQLPVHIPGIACRTLNAPNFQTSITTTNNNNNNSTNSSPTSSKNSPTLSPSSSVSTDSGIQNEFRIEDVPNEEKYIITNPFLNEQDDLDELTDLNELNEIMNKKDELKKLKTVNNAIPLTKPRSFGRQPPSYFDGSNDDQSIYINTTGPSVPRHNNLTSAQEASDNSSISNLTQQKQRIRIIPPKSSLFDEMNYNEIVNYMENMEESTA